MSFRSNSLALLAGASLLLAACGDDDGGGGDEKVSATDYASAVCTAFGDWRTEIQEQRDELQAGLEPGITPEEGKESLQGFLGNVVDATDQLVSDVDDAGTPEAENGGEVAEALQKIAGEAQSELEGAEAKVDELPTESREAFGAAASSFGTEVQTALSNVGGGLADIDSKELEKAFDEVEECQA